jgi:uncharacterized protein YecE (DUF72 family)
MPRRVVPGIFVGTSGWSYPHWSGRFYPADLPDEAKLDFYAQRFGSVEINSTFYGLPEPHTLEGWRDAVPDRFVFAVKASRYITHMKKLREPERTLPALLERVAVLGAKLGPILFQLPPHWHVNRERLEAFLDALPAGHRYAFELRDPSWCCDAILESLSRRGAAFCIYELGGYRSPINVTSELVYIRLHGPDGAYRGSYTQQALAGWARAISSWASQGREVHCYFDNDELGYAARNAADLAAMLEGAA